MQFSFRPIDAAAAAEIVGWCYSGRYAQYNQHDDAKPKAAAEMMRPELRFHVFDWDGRIGGFCSFGDDGRVAGWQYDDCATDVGAGLAPHLTGSGLGSTFLATVVKLANQEPGSTVLRATIASWNTRARRAASRAGFRETAEFNAPRGDAFTILLAAPASAQQR